MNGSAVGCEVVKTPGTGERMIRAATVVGTLSVFVVLATVLKELLIARAFGRGDAVDAFLIAYLPTSFLAELLAGTFNLALIPTFIRVRETEGKEAAQALYTNSAAFCSGVMMGAVVLLGWLAPFYLPLMGSGFAPLKLQLTRHLLYILLLFVVLRMMALNWSAILNAGERFALPAITPIVTPLVVVAFVVVLRDAWGIYALAIGTVVGSGIEAMLLALGVEASGIRIRPRWSGMDDHMRRVLREYRIMLAGQALTNSATVVDQSMAAMLKPGSVAALGYGKKVVSGATGIGAVAVGTAALPFFSQMVAKKQWQDCRRTLKNYGGLIFLATVPVAGGLILFSKPLIKVLYQRGAFTAADTSVVSSVQSFYSFQIPFYLLNIFSCRFLSSLRRNDLLAYGMAALLLLDIVLNLIFMRFWGVAGIALSTSGVVAISAAYTGFWALKLTHPEKHRSTDDELVQN